MNFREEYNNLKKPPEDADKKWYQSRGYKLEKIINELLLEEDLQPRTSYKTLGEQIDGSFVYGQRVFLLEAKWHKKEMPASKIYEFKGKVDGKLIGTVGIFISMSGYSSDAVDALMYGKDINILLFDKSDFDSAIDEGVGFSEVLNAKIRNAAEVGTAYYPYTRIDVIGEEDVKVGSEIEPFETQINHMAFDLHDKKLLIKTTESVDLGELVIICEGKSDQYILSILSEEIMKKEKINRKISIIPAMGKFSIAKIALNLEGSFDPNTKLLMIADSDGDSDWTEQRFKKIMKFNDDELILVDETIEDWLIKPDDDKKKIINLMRSNNRFDVIKERLNMIEFQKLRKEHKSFDKFYGIISSL